VPIQDRFK
jgi:hypothetical protein